MTAATTDETCHEQQPATPSWATSTVPRPGVSPFLEDEYVEHLRRCSPTMPGAPGHEFAEPFAVWVEQDAHEHVPAACASSAAPAGTHWELLPVQVCLGDVDGPGADVVLTLAQARALHAALGDALAAVEGRP